MAKLPGTRTREAGLDRALDKDSEGTSRKDGQDRAMPMVWPASLTVQSFNDSTHEEIAQLCGASSAMTDASPSCQDLDLPNSRQTAYSATL